MTLDPYGRSRGRRVLAVSAAGGCLILVVLGVMACVAAGIGLQGAIEEFVVTNATMGVAFPACGVLLATQRPRNPIGWLLIVDGAGHALTAAAAPVLTLALGSGWSTGPMRTLATVSAYAWPWSIALFLPLALLLFPDGRLPTTRWKPAVWITVGTAPLFVVETGAEPQAVPPFAQPWPVISDFDAFAPLWTVSELLRLVVLGLALAALVVRYRRGDDRDRRQLLWLALAEGLVLVVFVPWGVFAAGPVLILLAIPLIAVAMTIAILRHRLLDIRLVVSRALLYLLLTASVVVLYLALVAAVELVLRREVGRDAGIGTSVLVTLIVAVGFNPVRVRLQRLVDRLLYGQRTDPVGVATRLGAQLRGAGPGLDGVPDAIIAALRVPYAALRRDGVEVAAAGTTDDPTAPGPHIEPLLFGGEHVGELVVGLRRGQPELDTADERVLTLLATPIAVALRATALSDTVQRAREQLVDAREEERRRLRRDLHDGLGPALTGIAFQTDAARNLLRHDPDTAAGLLERQREAVTTAIDDVRRLVEGLRPPALDELGLLEVLRRDADRFSPVQVTIEAVEPLPTLSAAVEVAAYRIATEALTNATRHSQATTVTLRLRCGPELDIEIADDGGPSPRPWIPGVGLSSIAERAAELGGTTSISSSPHGGLVRARLPLTARAPQPSVIPS